MANIADITVTKFDDVTAALWSAITASGGDSSPAVWRYNAAGGTPGQRPELRMMSKPNSTRTGRKVTLMFTYPQLYTETNTSLTKVRNRYNATLEVFVPDEMSDEARREAGAQFGKLLTFNPVKSGLIEGYAPT